MDPFAPREHAPLEYWFWKMHVGDLAFLVDVIVRRRTGIAETRVSLWLRGEGRVEHAPASHWSADSDLVVVGATELRPGASHGAVGDIAWDLRWVEGPTLVTPLHRAVAWLEPLDLSIMIRPEARFSGTVDVAGERFEMTDLPGTFTHYWGRRLMDRWIWLSATQFDGAPDRRLEAIVSRSRLWGGPRLPTAAAYLWTTDGTSGDLVVSAINGIVRTRRVPDGFALDAVRLGGSRHRVVATWGHVPTNDLVKGSGRPCTRTSRSTASPPFRALSVWRLATGRSDRGGFPRRMADWPA